jgi:hypothetical protein
LGGFGAGHPFGAVWEEGQVAQVGRHSTENQQYANVNRAADIFHTAEQRAAATAVLILPPSATLACSMAAALEIRKQEDRSACTVNVNSKFPVN